VVRNLGVLYWKQGKLDEVEAVYPQYSERFALEVHVAPKEHRTIFWIRYHTMIVGKPLIIVVYDR